MTNLLITLLTSSNLEFLKISYECVKNQYKNNFNCKIIIVVNTLNDEYFDSVKEAFTNENVIRTESNGMPGKGHNSLLKIFEEETNYDYLLPIDGDDLLYPCALIRLENYLQYNPDVLFLAFSDVLSYDFPKNILHYGIKNKCYLKFNNYVKNMKELWYRDKKSPFDLNINNTNTPGRLVLCSRKSLNLKLNYDETLRWYDDFNIFLQGFEISITNKNYNIFMIDDNDLYLYNRLNKLSVTDQFKVDNQRKKIEEEKNFRKNIFNKFFAIRDWNLHKLNFLTNSQNILFKIKDKIKFIEDCVLKMNLTDININKSFYYAFIKYGLDNNYNDLVRIYHDN